MNKFYIEVPTSRAIGATEEERSPYIGENGKVMELGDAKFFDTEKEAEEHAEHINLQVGQYQYGTISLGISLENSIEKEQDEKVEKPEPTNELISYRGVKNIKAKPMTRGEHSKSKGFEKVLNGKAEDEGYQVIYEDGYESWSPKETFEKAYKESGSPLKQLIIERDELAEKLEQLKLAINSNSIPERHIDSCRSQVIHMHNYLDTLNIRITL